MRRDYRLHELNDREFEKLVVQICTRWLGQGVTPFAPGKDGGRDAAFFGVAEKFPSESEPLSGHSVVQAKHTASPNKSCSDREFTKLLDAEHEKVKALIAAGICDHYVVFTNRKLTGGAQLKLVASLLGLGLKSAHIVGVERLHMALDDYPDIANTLPNLNDSIPFRFDPEELVEVIGALHDYTATDPVSSFNSALDFEVVKLKDEKNPANGLTDSYYEELIVGSSMPHFPRIEDFLKNPRNKEFATLYHDAADELKQKILVNRGKFGVFDDVFAFLSEHVQQQRAALRGKRRTVNILLHYMYCRCDIGAKHSPPQTAGVNADA